MDLYITKHVNGNSQELAKILYFIEARVWMTLYV